MSSPNSSPHFDLTGMLQLQKNYAIDLTKIPIDPATNDSNNAAIINLNQGLNSLYSSVNQSQANSQAVLYKQKIINDILETEKQRLDAKKANVDTAISGQKRMIALNNNYQKRYAAYTRMLIAIVVGIVIYIFMDKLMVLLPFIPVFIFYALISIILGAIIFYVYLLWIDIQRREKMNYDELALTRPDVSALNEAAGDSSANGGPGGTTVGGPAAAPGPGGSNGAIGSISNIDYSKCVGQECCGMDQNTLQPIPWSPITGCAIPYDKSKFNTDTTFSS